LIVFDGVLDAKWIQHLGDFNNKNGMLFSKGGEILFKNNNVQLIFETSDLKNAPLGFLSR